MKIQLPHFPAFLFFVIVIATSCQAPQDLVYRDFKNLQVDKFGFASTNLKVDVNFYNPNNFGLQLKYTDLDIYIDSSYLGHSAQNYQITIPKRAEFTLPLLIEVDMKNLLRNALTTFLGREVNVRVTGKVTLGKANVFKTFTVNYEGRQTFTVF